MSEGEVLIEITKSEISENIVSFGKLHKSHNKHSPNALICWYKIRICGKYEYHTNRTGSFMSHMAIVLEDELNNVALHNKDVYLKVLHSHSLIDIKVL